jgi:CRP/FNR family transcriptional regulator
MSGRKLALATRAIPPFASREPEGGLELPPECVAALLKGAQPLELPQGKVLFHQGQSSNDCYWLARGLLKGAVEASGGVPLVVCLYGPGELVGKIPAIDGLPQPTTVEAVSDCRLVAIHHGSFQSALDFHPEFSRWLARLMGQRMRAAYDDRVATSLAVTGRVAHALLKLAMLAGEKLEADRMGLSFALSHDVLASLAGVSRESATRTLSQWRKQGVIDRSERYPIIILKDRLEREEAA